MLDKTPQYRRIGSLDAFEIQGDPHAPYIIFFHGYGADASDLLPLHQVLSVRDDINWIFPNGPLEVPIGPGFTGRAWFPIDMTELEDAMRRGTHRDFSMIAPPGLEEARNLAFEMLRELNVPLSRVVLGGFSQGAMLSTDITLRSEQSPAALVILSGTLLDRKSWAALAPQRRGLPFFQSHGFYDPLLGFAAAKQLEELLVDAGWNGNLIRFEGQHEIPPAIISHLSAFLREVLTGLN